MRGADGTWLGWGIGDNSATDPKVRNIKAYMRRMYPSYAELLANTNLFDMELQTAVVEMQRRLVLQNKLPANLYPNGILDAPTQYAMGFAKPPPPLKPVIFTVEGHMSNMFIGPAAETARILEAQGVCQWQPIGYDSNAIPFANDPAIAELINQFHRLIVPFPGRKFGLVGYSQGGIICSRFYMEHILSASGALPPLLPQLKRAVMFGNPCREKGVIRPGMPNPPPPTTRGIADVRMKDTPPFWWEFAHRGDIYTAVPDDDTGEHMTAIYEIIQNNWTRGQNSIIRQLFELFTNPGPEIWAVFTAITKGIMFAGNTAPHGGFDIGPAVEHMRGVGS